MSLLIKQEGLCAICKDPLRLQKSFFGIDHCHKTGKVRGILCICCNTGLGSFRDSIDKLEEAIGYIRTSLQ